MSEPSNSPPASADPVATNLPPQNNSPLLEPLRTAISAAKRPFCVAGDIPITSSITLTILPDEHTPQTYTAVRFPPISPEGLAPLIDACKQASFGRGKKEVLDSDYRQALVLSNDRFGVVPHSAIDPLVLGILPAIQGSLYPTTDFGGVAQRRVVAELDKLNVYGVGDFFKGHVDTPRSSDMFGTLLINLPVKHEGGTLVVHAPDGHPEGAEPRKTSWGGESSIGWIAFFSDCLHEVLPVTSGNRVTLTYNLSIAPPSEEPSASVDQTLGGVQDPAFSGLLDALKVSDLSGPHGPLLCFHLEHRYPVVFNDDTASTAIPILKGCDAVVYRAFRAAGLEVTLHYVCIVPPDGWGHPKGAGNKAYILPPGARESGEGMWEEGFTELINAHDGLTPDNLGVLEIQPPKDIERKFDQFGYSRTDPDSIIGAPFRYTAYGNEPSVRVDYASICIIGSPPGRDLEDDWPERVDSE